MRRWKKCVYPILGGIADALLGPHACWACEALGRAMSIARKPEMTVPLGAPVIRLSSIGPCRGCTRTGGCGRGCQDLSGVEGIAPPIALRACSSVALVILPSSGLAG